MSEQQSPLRRFGRDYSDMSDQYSPLRRFGRDYSDMSDQSIGRRSGRPPRLR
jgi:hypothetical protein